MNGAAVSRPAFHRIAIVQIALLLSVCALLWLTPAISTLTTGSFLAGGLLAVLPQAWFAAKLFRHAGARSAKAVVRAAYVGETGKFLISIAGFAALFALVTVDAPAVFSAYLLMLIVQWIGSALLVRRYTQ